jgi:hypothetical protein
MQHDPENDRYEPSRAVTLQKIQDYVHSGLPIPILNQLTKNLALASRSALIVIGLVPAIFSRSLRLDGQVWPVVSKAASQTV